MSRPDSSTGLVQTGPMPRSNRPSRRATSRAVGRDVEADPERGLVGMTRLESGPDGDWLVRPVTGAAATKTYRCPGCDQQIPAGVAHLVAWPAAGLTGQQAAVAERRHWHRACWSARERRRPAR